MNILDLDLDNAFQECFTTTGGAVTDCSCGREHVAINSEYFDDEDEEMIVDYYTRAEEGDKVILRSDVDSIGLIEVGGHYFAEDCPCNGWKRYKDFILTHRSEIKDFLIKVAEQAHLALDREKTFNILKDNKLKVLDDHRF